MEYTEFTSKTGAEVEIRIANPHNINPRYEATIKRSGQTFEVDVNPALIPIDGRMRYAWMAYIDGTHVAIPHGSAGDAFND